MTPSDDELDALLRGFRAEEARLDDATRARLDARIRGLVDDTAPAPPTTGEPARHGATPALPTASEPPDPPRRDEAAAPLVGRSARSARGRRAWWAAAAAVLVAALVGGVVARSATREGLADDARTAPAGTTADAPPLPELARRAALEDGPQLGEPGATYAHQVATRTIEIADTVTSGRTEIWVAADGTGRIAEVGAPDDEGVMSSPGAIEIGGLPTADVLALPDDADEVFAAFDRANAPSTLTREDYATGIADALATAGLPPAARAGLLRGLAELGYAPSSDVDAATGTARYEGPGAGGSTVVLAIDPTRGVVVSIQQTWPDGRRTSTAYAEVDLRADLTS